MQKQKILKIILWTARVLGAIVIAFLLIMAIGEFSSTGSKTDLMESSYLITFLLFPISTIIGLCLAYKWKGLGGLITIGGMITLHIVRPDLASDLLISAFAIPGLLYIIYSVWSKG